MTERSTADRLKEKYGDDYFSTLAKRGGKRLFETKGRDHFSQMGKKGLQILKERHTDDDFFHNRSVNAGLAKAAKYNHGRFKK